MTEISYRSDSSVTLIQHVGSDHTFARAARVSTDTGSGGEAGLINYLLKHRHMSPFEHSSLTFEIETPIFVAREFMRHRTGAYSEVSGRYTQLAPTFWVPDEKRGLENIGTSARPKMGTKSLGVHPNLESDLIASYTNLYRRYASLIESGIANEVARTILPVGTYTKFWATMNLRNWFAFLSLRVDHEDNAYDTYPQAEIQEVAEQIEQSIADLFPLTHAAFAKNGRHV